MTAMMALQPPEEAVLDEPRRAVRASHAMAAGVTKRQRRVAPSVQEQQDLFTGGQGLTDRGDQRWREKALSRRLVAAQIDRLNDRQQRATVTIGKVDAVVTLVLDIGERFERRCCRDENDGNAGERAAHHGHVAGVINYAVLLLEGAVMLLVDDDEAEFGKRREQCRACADHDP